MRERISTGNSELVCQKWKEMEKGWGDRPDGFSLHVSLDGLKRYIKEYWETMPDIAPDYYDAPDGTPYSVEVDMTTYQLA